jgi:hypothetical protein
MGKRLVRLRQLLSVGLACVRALPFGHTVKVQRSAEVCCCGCGERGHGLQTTRINRHAVAKSAAEPPDGWGIRYQRRPGNDPLPTYSCGPCAHAAATGKLKV